MKRINISTPKYQETYTLISDEDYEAVSKYNWTAMECGGRLLARRSCRIDKKHVKIALQNFLLNPKVDKSNVVTHIDKDPLNNQRSNLKLIKRGEYIAQSDTRSIFKGVSRNNNTKKPWLSCFIHKGIRHYLGNFELELDAATAYNRKLLELGGDIRKINVLNEREIEETINGSIVQLDRIKKDYIRGLQSTYNTYVDKVNKLNISAENVEELF